MEHVIPWNMHFFHAFFYFYINFSPKTWKKKLSGLENEKMAYRTPFKIMQKIAFHFFSSKKLKKKMSGLKNEKMAYRTPFKIMQKMD
jgi:hypothetical protein